MSACSASVKLNIAERDNPTVKTCVRGGGGGGGTGEKYPDKGTTRGERKRGNESHMALDARPRKEQRRRKRGGDETTRDFVASFELS